MVADLVAEAGLSECARTDMDCMPGFGKLLVELALAGAFTVLWLALAVSASVAILSWSTRIFERVLWVAAVWVAPLVGAIAWFIHARRHQTSGRQPRTEVL
ncbi:hypothetical protein [Rhodococcus sp. UNC363MFTsu5.1]|uniref:hypothetical protein n=1 Tax=Rhodococcus sp. UNC363MFTsu5.1 TaxID=1449069 RepID=UPI00068F0FD3|nr:hypothetical protein [Rhodococcus sp. UNC363MFTsu5.1]